jgi:hypothetical protein
MAEETNRPDDELLAQGEDLERLSAAARLFDVRRVIGGLFVVYGVIVTLLGIFDTDAEIDKAVGVRINLWMGLAMLVLGGFFLLWLWWRPAVPRVPPADRGADARPERPTGA